MYLTMKSYGKIPISTHCSVSVACVKCFAGTFFKGSCLSKTEVSCQTKHNEISPWPKQVIHVQLLHMLLGLVGSSSWECKLGAPLRVCPHQCSISHLINDMTYWCLDVHLLLYYECLCDWCYLQVCMFIYTMVVPPISICLDFLLVSYYSMLDVLVVHICILYYNHNIFLLLTKQNLDFMWCSQHGYTRQMMMHINWWQNYTLILECYDVGDVMITWGVYQDASLSSFHTILPYVVLITLSQSLCFWSMFLSTDLLFSLILCSLFSTLSSSLLSMSQFDVECSFVGLFVTGPLTMFILLLLVPGCLSSWFKMLSNQSVLTCLCSWSQRYCSADMGVGFMCCLFLMTSLCVFGMWMWYDMPWWFWLPVPSIVPWVHSPSSSHWTTTVHPMGIETYILGVSLPLSCLVCLFTITLKCSWSLSMPTGGLLIAASIPLIRWLNSMFAGLGSPCLSGVIHVHNRAMCGSLL